MLPNQSPAGTELNGKIQGATGVAGRFPGKWALEFKQPQSGVKVNLPKEMKSMTLVAWVNIESLPHLWNGLLMSDGDPQSGQFAWLLNEEGRFSFRQPPESGWVEISRET